MSSFRFRGLRNDGKIIESNDITNKTMKKCKACGEECEEGVCHQCKQTRLMEIAFFE